MSTIFPTSVPSKRLAESITAASTSFKLNSITGWDGNDLASTDFGTVAYAVFRNSSSTLMEIMEIDPATITSASSPITINKRGMSFDGDLTTETSANKLTWVKGDTVVELGTDVPQLLKSFVDIYGDQTVAGIKTFSSSPIVPTPTTNFQAATKAYADSLAFAGAPDASTTAKGLVEEATEAEIEAGTAAGSTSARLFVNPNTLKSSDYGTKIYNRYGDYAADAGSNDTYVITLAPAPTAYTTGMYIQFKPNTANTGACTINVNGLGAQVIKKEGSATPVDNDLVPGRIYELIYDGTNFQLLNPSTSTVPAGTLLMYGAASAPNGYLLCDGSQVSRTTYAALFAVISTSYGTGDGSSTFDLPDFRGRVPIGSGTGTGGGSSGTGAPSGGSALTAVSIGTWKGEETHVLTVGELAAHTHTATGASAGPNYSTASAAVGTSTNAGTGNSTSAVSGSAGSDTAHNNIQPVAGVAFIIKT